MKIKSLKRMLVKSIHDPRYFRYYVCNVGEHYIKTLFPTIYRFFKPKPLDLGGAAGLKQLHVIMRTTDQVMNINATRNLEDIGIMTRNDVIRVGGCSLFKAAEQFAKAYGRENIRITIVADNLSEKGMTQYREAAATTGLTFDVVEMEDHGNAPSFHKQIDIALQDPDDTLAFILEDDYLLDEASLTTCFRLMRNHSHVIGMNPHFHPDRVRRQDIGLLTAIEGRLYCRIFNTCCTFFMPVSQMRHHEKHLRAYRGWEDESVNQIWKRGICLSPLGWTLAEALHRSELSPVTSLIEHDT